MPEIDARDIPGAPLDIADDHLAALVAYAQRLVSNNALFPTDMENRLRSSAIFASDDKAVEVVDLPSNIYENIRELKRAIQSRRFYVQPQASTTHLELSMNNILCSTYLLHGTGRIRSDGSEINLIVNSVAIFLSPFFSAHDKVQIEFDSVSWAFKQGKAIDKDKLRPDILIHAEQHGNIIEVACGEVKNANASQEKLNEDKMRVLEVMKRQLHTRLRYAKSINEAVTFGIVVQGKF